jgi:hypothetical protein
VYRHTQPLGDLSPGDAAELGFRVS